MTIEDDPPADAVHRTIDAVWKIECAKLMATLTRICGDVGTAEDLGQDALVAALEQWPVSGVPDKPGAWLLATAKNRAIDLLRRRRIARRVEAELGAEFDARQRAVDDLDHRLDEAVGDDVLRLIFVACHPLLTTDARAALTLRVIGGLTTGEIARAFLSSEPTIAQRIVRAKRTLADAQVPFEVPRGVQLEERLPSVLEVLYLIFNEGYAATAGEHWVRQDLCDEGLRLARILAELMPGEPEVLGLAALLELQASRLRARSDHRGQPILLLDQDRSRWDRLLIHRGLAALERAEALGRPRGSYVLQAEIAACHARATVADATDWMRIATLYAALATVTPSPVVELNRAVAVAMALGPEAGLLLADRLTAEPSLAGYHHLPSVRGDLLAKLGRAQEAQLEFERAAALTHNACERALLLERAAQCAASRRPAGPPDA